MRLYLGILFLCVTKIDVYQCGGTFKTIQTGPKPIWNETVVDRLKKDLLSNYDRFARPEHHNFSTPVKLSLTILRVEIDEKSSTLSTDAWIHIEWTDNKLKWAKDDYEGVSVIRVADHEVWQPDIYLYNSAAGSEQPQRAGSKNVLIYSNGKILWVPSIKLTSLCNYDLLYWPFDTQYCRLKFGSWTRSSNEINLELETNTTEASLESTVAEGSWIINSTAYVEIKKYNCCLETYESITYNLTLVRKSAPYNAIVVTPAIVSVFLILGQFWLPPYAGEKIILNGFTAMILNLFLLYFSHQIVSVGPNTPLIVLFYSRTLYILACSMVGATIIYLMCITEKTKPLPTVIKRLLRGRCGRWFLLEQYSPEMFTTKYKNGIEEMNDHRVSNSNRTSFGKIQYRQDWIVFAVFLDRISFIIYSIAFVGLAIGLA